MQALSIAYAPRRAFTLSCMEIDEVRRKRLLWLRDNEFGGKSKRLSDQLKRSPSQVGQWLTGHRTISPDTARMIEAAVGFPKYWLDGDVPGNVPEPSPMAQRVAREFDKIAKERQAEAFVKVLEQLERDATVPVPESLRPDPQPRRKRPQRQ